MKVKLLILLLLNLPTNPFRILVPEDQEIGELYAAKKCCATDFEAPKFSKGSSGYSSKQIIQKKLYNFKPTGPFISL